MDDLKAQGADSFIWSVGSDAPINTLASNLSAKYAVETIASMDHGTIPSSGAIIDSSGDAYTYTDIKLNVAGYSGKANLRMSSLDKLNFTFL